MITPNANKARNNRTLVSKLTKDLARKEEMLANYEKVINQLSDDLANTEASSKALFDSFTKLRKERESSKERATELYRELLDLKAKYERATGTIEGSYHYTARLQALIVIALVAGLIIGLLAAPYLASM